MIPEDWLSITLGQACKEKIKTGPFGSQLHAHEYVESGIPVIMPKDLLNGNIIIDKAARISQEKADVLSKHKLENGDLIFSRRGNVTCAAIVTVKEVGCICGTGCLRVRLDKNCVSPPFLNALIQNENVKDWLESNAVGQTMLNLNTTILSNLPVQIPPLLEQCRIAEILGVWDESIDLLERLIGRVRSRKQGLMQQLLTGKKRFKEFEGSEWKEGLVSDLIKSLDAGVSVNSEDRCIEENELGILKTSAVTYGVFAPDENKVILSEEVARAIINPRRDRIIISRMNTPNLVGASVYISKDYPSLFLPDRLWQAEPKSNNFSMRWLSYVLASDIYREKISNLATGTSNSMKNIAKSSILKMSMMIPSLPEQEKIAAVLSAADEEISTLEKQLAAYKQQKLGLMQQLLTGKIRVG